MKIFLPILLIFITTQTALGDNKRYICDGWFNNNYEKTADFQFNVLVNINSNTASLQIGNTKYEFVYTIEAMLTHGKVYVFYSPENLSSWSEANPMLMTFSPNFSHSKAYVTKIIKAGSLETEAASAKCVKLN